MTDNTTGSGWIQILHRPTGTQPYALYTCGTCSTTITIHRHATKPKITRITPGPQPCPICSAIITETPWEVSA